MKKIIYFLLFALIISFAFSACQGSNPAVTNIYNNNDNYLVAEFQNGVLPTPAYAGCEDTMIGTLSPSNNYGTAAQSYIGYVVSATPFATRYLVKFDVNSIPRNATIKKAFFSINGYLVSAQGYISCYKKTKSWDVSTITWDTIPAGGGEFDASPCGGLAIDTAKFYNFSFSPSIVQDWVNDPSHNFGLIFKSSTETAPSSYLFCYHADCLAASEKDQD